SFVEPGEGYLACGWIGKGRLAEPEAVVDAAERLVPRSKSLAGRRIVVTAGPTHEFLDPVRFIGNRSSGKMGIAIAGDLAARGAEVTLITGPTSVALPAVAAVVRVRAAAEMHRAVMEAAAGADALVMAAAVANYTPETVADQKIAHDLSTVSLRLVPTTDIIAEGGSRREGEGGSRQAVVGV